MPLPEGLAPERVRDMLRQVWEALAAEWPPEMPAPTQADRRAALGVASRLEEHATDRAAMAAFLALPADERKALLDWTWPSTSYRA